jgi:hypothetical protein
MVPASIGDCLFIDQEYLVVLHVQLEILRTIQILCGEFWYYLQCLVSQQIPDNNTKNNDDPKNQNNDDAYSCITTFTVISKDQQ